MGVFCFYKSENLVKLEGQVTCVSGWSESSDNFDLIRTLPPLRSVTRVFGFLKSLVSPRAVGFSQETKEFEWFC